LLFCYPVFSLRPTCKTFFLSHARVPPAIASFPFPLLYIRPPCPPFSFLFLFFFRFVNGNLLPAASGGVRLTYSWTVLISPDFLCCRRIDFFHFSPSFTCFIPSTPLTTDWLSWLECTTLFVFCPRILTSSPPPPEVP